MKRESVKGVNKNQIEQFSLQEDFVAPKIIIEIMLVSYVLVFSTIFGGNLFKRFDEVSIYIYAFALLMIIAFDQKLECKDLLHILLFALYCFSTTFFNGGGLGGVATIVLPLVLLCCFEYSKFGLISKYLIKCFTIIYNVYFLFISFAYTYDYTILNTLNSNTGCVLALISFALWAIFTDFTELRNKILFFLLAITSFLIIKNFQGRGSLLAFAVFVLSFVLPKKILPKKVFIIVIGLIFVFSFIFPLIYLSLYNNGVNLTVFGKNLYTGREGIWQNMMDAFSEKGILSVLFGLGSKAALWEGHNLNVHHENYVIVVNFGIFGLIFYYAFIIKKLINVFKYYDDTLVRKALYFVLALVVLGFVESVSFWSTLYVFTLFGLGVLLGRTNELEKNKLRLLYKEKSLRPLYKIKN